MPTHTKDHTDKSVNFQGVIDAVEARERDWASADQGLWEIGRALFAICGPPGPQGPNDGSHKVLGDVARVLKERGYKNYSLTMLRLIRRVYVSFLLPHDKRLSSQSWSVHMQAGNRPTLDAVVEEATRNGVEEITVGIVKQFKKQQRRRMGKSGLSAALRKLDDALVLINKTTQVLTSLEEHMPNLSEDNKVKLHQKLPDPLVRLINQANVILQKAQSSQHLDQEAA